MVWVVLLAGCSPTDPLVSRPLGTSPASPPQMGTTAPWDPGLGDLGGAGSSGTAHYPSLDTGRVPSDPPQPHDVVSGPSLTVDLPLGIRDLRASADEGASVRWVRDHDGYEVLGDVVDAADVVPGDRWDVFATDAIGTTRQQVQVPEAPGGNVLLLVVDDIGIDHIGAYGVGTEAPLTPRIDALADEGVRFQRAYASPNCSPTRGQVMSGRHGRRTGLGWIVDTGTRDGQLPIDTITLPESLWDARSLPWSSVALGKWHMAGDDAEDYLTHPNRSGFDHFSGTWGNPSYQAGNGYDRWQRNTNGEQEWVEGYLTTATVDDTLDQVATLPEPWFLYVGFHAAHTPLTDPPEGLTYTPLPAEPTLNDKFNAVVEAFDIELGRLLDEMDPDLRERTTIVLLGDNGTPHHAVDPPLDPTHAKGTGYEQGVRVPLVVVGPHAAQGEVQDALVHAVDMYTLVAEIAGVPLSGTDQALRLLDGTVLDGQAMLPLLADPARAGRDVVYTEGFFPNGPGPYSKNKRGVRDERWSLVREGTNESFFDLGSEPTLEEGTNLLAGTMTTEEQDAWLQLTSELDGFEIELAYEGR